MITLPEDFNVEVAESDSAWKIWTRRWDTDSPPFFSLKKHDIVRNEKMSAQVPRKKNRHLCRHLPGAE
jgi:hypothetical protein